MLKFRQKSMNIKGGRSNYSLITVGMLLYYLFDIIFPHGRSNVEVFRIIPQTIMAIICIFCIAQTIINYRIISKCHFTKPFIWYSTIAFIYIFYPCWGEYNLYDNFLFFLKSYVAIYFIFLILIHLRKNEKKTIFLSHIIFYAQIIYIFIKLIYDKQISLVSEEDYFDSNTGFMLVCCIPFSLMIKQKKYRLYIYFLLVIGCIYSGQRSSALTAVVTIPVVFFFLRKQIRLKDLCIIICAIIVLGLPILSEAYDNILARNLEDASKDSIGSGRNIFWKYVWDDFWNGNIFQCFFGRGTNTVPSLLLKKYGIAIGAHNGWLDNLYSFGFLGFAFYIQCLFSLFYNNRKINNCIPKLKNIALLVFILLFVKVTTTHGYWDITVIPISFVIANIFHQYSKSIRLKQYVVNHEKNLIH